MKTSGSSPFFSRLSAFAIAAMALGSTVPAANACSVCMGADPQTGEAINGAIFFMLGCIGFVLTAICGVAFTIWRRSRAVPAHVSFAQSIPDPS